MKRILYIAFAFATLMSCEAFALSRLPPPVVREQFTLSFSSKSPALSDSNKVALARHIPRIHSIHFEFVAIRLWTSQPGQITDVQKLSPLNIKRRQSIRGFFVDLGIPENRIYFETKSLNSPTDAAEPAEERKDGLIQIWYSGPCKDGYESMCVDRQDAQPIIPPDAAR